MHRGTVEGRGTPERLGEASQEEYDQRTLLRGRQQVVVPQHALERLQRSEHRRRPDFRHRPPVGSLEDDLVLPVDHVTRRDPAGPHQPREVYVEVDESVQPGLDRHSLFEPRGGASAEHRPRFEQTHPGAPLHELVRGRQPGQPATDDDNVHGTSIQVLPQRYRTGSISARLAVGSLDSRARIVEANDLTGRDRIRGSLRGGILLPAQ